MGHQTRAIFAAMALGVVAGLLLHASLSPSQAHAVATGLSLGVRAFLRLIQMVVTPLVFATLTAAVARTTDAGGIGRMGLKAAAWFVLASVVSLALGAAFALWLRPGDALALVATAQPTPASALTVADFVDRLTPASIVDAMARNDILQVAIFSLFAGAAMSALGERSAVLLEAVEGVAAVAFRVVDMVMVLAAPAVFCALASALAERGAGLLGDYVRFVTAFGAALIVLWAFILASAWALAGRPPGAVLRAMRQPMLVALATTSSEAAYPRTLEALQASGVRPRVASFVLPLGYAFNLDGTMLYAPFAVLFIAQAYGVALDAAQVGLLLLLLFAASKGVAAAPRAVLAVIAATLPTFHIPLAGLALIVGVDHLFDMTRSATNVLGNYVAACIVDRFEQRPCSSTAAKS